MNFRSRRSSMRSSLAILAVVAAANAEEPVTSRADLDFFEKQIRPILAEHCYECHGPETQKSDLRLDHISTILAGGNRGPALIAGQPEASRIVEAINYGNVDLQMPPRGKLEDAKIAALTDWIQRGALWPDEPVPSPTGEGEAFDLQKRAEEHWAWQPIQNNVPPAVANEDWPLDPIDRFILAKLEDAGYEPAPPADKRTLLRRVTFDLIGLPPTPTEVDAFLADDQPGAYERAVDRLLASPHFGERWARHWMDLVRYAETYGHEQDYPIRHAWQYRDYLIRAFNADVPYDQLVAEHIAGDLLPQPRLNDELGINESVIGTGFWYMHQATHGPVDVAQDEADRIDNQIDVFTKAFMGMTVSCARCHDHKFDAISTADYYALTGFLRSSRQEFAFLDPKNEITNRAAELEPIRENGSAALTHAVQRMRLTGAPRIGAYLLAARDVILGDGARTVPNETRFADFETDAFGDWNVEGNAFGTTPAEATRDETIRNDAAGDRLADSGVNGDTPTGTLTSPAFTIARPYMRFLVGGGAHANKTYAALLIDGEPVRKASGRNDDTLRTVVWDVREFIGRTATFSIVDAHEGTWGYLLVDEIVFTDSPYRRPIARPVAEVASNRQVDPEVMDRWLRQFANGAADAPSHPFHAWNALLSAEDLAAEAASLRAALNEKRSEESAARERYTPYEDFAHGHDHWFPSGHAFLDRPVQTGDWFAANGMMRAAAPGVAHSGLVSPKLQGVLRSPTFTLEHDSIHFRVAGERARIRLVVGQFQLREFNPLLFESTLFDVNTGGAYQWRTMTRSLSKFKGRPAYLELIDEGDGYIAVDEILFSNEESIEPEIHPANLAALEALDEAATLEKFATVYERIAQDAVRAWLDGEDNGLFPWLFAEGMVCAGDKKGALASFAQDLNRASESIPDPMRVLAITEGTPVDAAVMVRGNPKLEGDVVPRRFLEALEEEPKPINGGSGRMNLLENLFDPKNPLPPRVAANRLWHYLFGRGIVPTTDDFGVLGETPSHPELLDYLATEFRASGWSMKGFIRRLVLTQTYRMSSAPHHAEAERLDPANILLHRMNVRRLQGEAVRDSVLYTAGTLNAEMFGPSVPIYLSPFMGLTRRPPTSGPMDGDRRRTIYVEVRRNFLSPMMLAFDMPLPDSTTGKRTVSNIPAQALILMNDPFIVEQAAAWGERLAADADRTTEARITEIFETTLSRPPRPGELERVQAFAHEQAAALGIAPEDVYNDARVWRDLCHVMYMLKEFVYIG